MNDALILRQIGGYYPPFIFPLFERRKRDSRTGPRRVNRLIRNIFFENDVIGEWSSYLHIMEKLQLIYQTAYRHIFK